MSGSFDELESTRIGLVSSVDANHVSVQLDQQVSGLVKSSAYGVVSVGAVNSYVCIPVAHYKVVARVDRIQLQQGALDDNEHDRDELTSRSLSATIIGRIENGQFDGGLTAYPSIFSSVHAATNRDLDLILAMRGNVFPIEIGTAPAAGHRPVWLDANKLLSRHTLIVGSTGSGKSCTVMGVIDSLFENDLPSANVIVFDSNGEYLSALSSNAERAARTTVVALGPGTGAEYGLLAPHWLMNSDEHISMLRAGEGIQAPLLQRAIADARTAAGGIDAERRRLQSTSAVIAAVRALIGGSASKKPQEPLSEQLSTLNTLVGGFADSAPKMSHWRDLNELLSTWRQIGLNPNSWNPPDANQLHRLVELCERAEAFLRDGLNELGLGTDPSGSDFDAPVPYSLQDLADHYLPARISVESRIDPRLQNYTTGLSMRLARMLADSRYDFIGRVPDFDRSLARFLRLILGWGPLDRRPGEDDAPWVKHLWQQEGAREKRQSIVVLDLSLVALDVLEEVTALLGRVVLDVMVRMRPRGAMPTVLVLEEAHRFVPAQTTMSNSRSSKVFERIAKEGRKFGLGLVLATQRPSELSPTVASQCGTLIAHRLANAADQNLLRFASPYSSKSMLEQLSGLAQQHALIVGESITTATLVRIRDVPDAPHGVDADFMGKWSDENFDGGAQLDEIADAWQPHVDQPDDESWFETEAPPEGEPDYDDPPF